MQKINSQIVFKLKISALKIHNSRLILLCALSHAYKLLVTLASDFCFNSYLAMYVRTSYCSYQSLCSLLIELTVLLRNIMHVAMYCVLIEPLKEKICIVTVNTIGINSRD